MEYTALSESVIKGSIQQAVQETEKAVQGGADPQSILDQGLIAAMDIVGERFAQGKIFVPQMLRSAKTMQECVIALRPYFTGSGPATKGKVVMGTVRGDLHDIGKNLVAMMLEGAGFTIIDLGVGVAPEKFAQTVADEGAHIVGMSALLSITMPAMADTIKALESAGLRDKVLVMIGGAPVTGKYAEEIGADAYAPDAGSAVTKAKELLNIA